VYSGGGDGSGGGGGGGGGSNIVVLDRFLDSRYMKLEGCQPYASAAFTRRKYS
jgi:hypothetical protein